MLFETDFKHTNLSLLKIISLVRRHDVVFQPGSLDPREHPALTIREQKML